MEQSVPGEVTPPSPAADSNAAPATQAPVDQSAEATNAEQPEEGTPEQPRKEKESIPPWMRRQVSKARDRAIAAETKALMLEERLARLEARGVAGQQDDQQFGNQPDSAIRQHQEDPASIRREVESRVAFDLKCNDTFDKGAKEFGKEFESNLENLKEVGINERALRVIVDADAPHKVLHYLGSNPEEAEAIFDLPPVQMARALGRIEANLAAPKSPPKISSAPEPVRPVTTRSTGSAAPTDKDDMQTWLQKREAQLRARGGR